MLRLCCVRGFFSQRHLGSKSFCKRLLFFSVMGKTSGSNSSFCKPLEGKCKLSRTRAGLPVVCSKKCLKCGEYRCRSHCRCAREGTAVGRCAPRSLAAQTQRTLEKAVTSSQASVTSTPPLTESLKPRGAPSATTWKKLPCEDWFQDLFSCLDSATAVELSTCMCLCVSWSL